MVNYYFDFFDINDSRNGYLAGTSSYDFVRRSQLFFCEIGVKPHRAYTIAKTLCSVMSDTELHYHTYVHVLSILDFAKTNNITLTQAQQLAIWFHDSIYEVGKPNNEKLSAKFMHSLMGYSELTWTAASYIEQTEHFFSETSLTEEANMIMDLDICAFAGSVADKYDLAIEAEFVPVYGKEAFRKGRKEFFEKMLAKKKIYRSEFMAQFEEIARINLTRFKDML